ncbi:Protein of unknown function [Cotesia congregata]|uniref:Uncharacterized protein n=1 Tax=Cotesia congregata TaxID=51543 RepID=A0A8J2E0S4_COTCN|nr:Protein of unknown function [Cotesia congregata]
MDEPPDIRRSERIAAKNNNISFVTPHFSTTAFEHSFVELPSEVTKTHSVLTPSKSVPMNSSEIGTRRSAMYINLIIRAQSTESINPSLVAL